MGPRVLLSSLLPAGGSYPDGSGEGSACPVAPPLCSPARPSPHRSPPRGMSRPRSWRCRSGAVGSDFSVNAPGSAPNPRGGRTMKYMLMMHAPRGTGDYQINSWPAEDFAAHIDFMRRLNKDLVESGELVSVEGLAAPGQARIVRAAKN